MTGWLAEETYHAAGEVFGKTSLVVMTGWSMVKRKKQLAMERLVGPTDVRCWLLIICDVRGT